MFTQDLASFVKIKKKKKKKSTSGNKYARIIANTALYHLECTFTELIFCAYSKNTYGCQCYPSAF